MDLAAELARLRFPIGDERAPLQRDADRYARDLAGAVPLSDFLPHEGEGRFHCRSALVQTGAIHVGNGGHTGASAVIGGDQALATLFLPLLGKARFGLDNRWLEARAHHSLVYLSGEAHRAESGLYAGASVSLPPTLLAAAAAELAGNPGALAPYLASCQGSRQIDLDTPLTRHLHNLIERCLTLVNPLPQADGVHLREEQTIERLLIRLVAVLLHPRLAESNLPALQPHRPRRRAGLHPRPADPEPGGP